MQKHKLSMKELDELYPDDPPRRNATPVVIYHEFRNSEGTQARGLDIKPSRRQQSPSRMHDAWLALKMMLMVLGGVVSIAYVAALPRMLQFAAVAVAALIFLLLYKMIRQLDRAHGR